MKPIKVIEYTNNFDPIPFPGVDVGQGISGLIRDVSETGLAVLDRGSQLVENVVDKGINVLSEPIKIIIITASIIGGIIVLLLAYKYFLAKEGDNAKVNTAINLQLHPRDDHYPVCRMDIRPDSKFSTGYGYPKRVFLLEQDPDKNIRFDMPCSIFLRTQAR